MKKFLLFFALFFSSVFIILLISTCTKEYSYEGGPLAAYTLVGEPDECANVIIHGNYATDIPLDSSNYVQVTAHVTLSGNYTISTNTVDGITFSASGNFPDTGFYDVTLKATGTPGAEGIYQLQIVGNSACFFSIEVDAKPMADYVLSGSLTDCENPDIKGNYTQGLVLSGSNTVTLNVEVFATGDYIITTDTASGIYFSASGTFTATGKQQVTLQGTGTPDAPGLIYFNVTGGNSQCAFKIPIQNSSPVATYVLESGFGNTSPCSIISSSGIYTAGVPLTADNSITISAYVTVLGNFTVSTDSANGMIFKYTGQFTTTGKQPVTLYGSGTPNSSGVYSFRSQIIGPAIIGGEACGFTITVQ
jgi:hypothetical protein